MVTCAAVALAGAVGGGRGAVTSTPEPLAGAAGRGRRLGNERGRWVEAAQQPMRAAALQS
jgi:hypothetical protein